MFNTESVLSMKVGIFIVLVCLYLFIRVCIYVHIIHYFFA